MAAVMHAGQLVMQHIHESASCGACSRASACEACQVSAWVGRGMLGHILGCHLFYPFSHFLTLNTKSLDLATFPGKPWQASQASLYPDPNPVPKP